MAKILADARTVHDLMSGKSYQVDYFQREYRWGEEQIHELIDDLTGRFLSAWRPDHVRKDRQTYPAYFLGSVIIAGKGEGGSIIDGQQRLTSLTILLIWLHRHLEVADDKAQVAKLIYSYVDGEHAYNIDVPERTPAFQALFHQDGAALPDQPIESVRNILDRHEDIEERMPEQLRAGLGLVMFTDWLLRNVFLVEIRTSTDDEAYAIFESMNDRGLALTETDMLKGHLLSKVGSEQKRAQLNTLWKQRVEEVLRLEGRDQGGKPKDGEAIKAWLRARHALTNRLREQGAKPEDFDRIGTEFHRWVRDKAGDLDLKDAASYARFVERDFDFYTRWYLRLRDAAATLTQGREAIHCNALANFTLQYPLMLAPIRLEDDEATGWRKAMVVATFVDILIARRQWNERDIGYSTMQYAMFLVIKAIRSKSAEECAALLSAQLEADAPPFSANTMFGMGYFTKKTMRRMLARISAWLDEQLGTAGMLAAYLKSSGATGHDIEHIVHDDYAALGVEFGSQEAFNLHRNRIGGLLLLPRSVNRSVSNKPYEEKRNVYLGQGGLAKTLHEGAYVNNPQLRRLIEVQGLPFKPHTAFGLAELEDRQALLLHLAEQVWHPSRLVAAAAGDA